MNKITPYPLRFAPHFVEKVWGGQRLRTHLQKEIPSDRPLGESWEVFDLADGSSQIANGVWQGRALNEIVRQHADILFGDGTRFDHFPLLVKFIDANDVLSVQVHPDDAHAQRFGEQNGKTESWLVLDSTPAGEIICGLKPNVDRAQMAQAILDGSITDLLLRFPAHPGEFFFVKAGTTHAIGAGVLLLEIQQNSNTTFRVYDWGRVGLDGQPRELHIEQALQVTDFQTEVADLRPAPITKQANGIDYTQLVAGDYFVIDRFEIEQPTTMPRQAGHFEILVNIGGQADIVSPTNDFEPVSLSLGEIVLLPATLDSYQIETSGCTLIRSFRPKKW